MVEGARRRGREVMGGDVALRGRVGRGFATMGISREIFGQVKRDADGETLPENLERYRVRFLDRRVEGGVALVAHREGCCLLVLRWWY